MPKLDIDMDYVLQIALDLINIPSPAGYTDDAVRYLGHRLEELDIPFELTRRGAIRADLKGKQTSPDRAIVSHLDTLGAMVKEVKDNGRLRVVPVGHWSSRFAEGARVSVISDDHVHRGTILPLKASGHVYGDEIDTQPSDWKNVEVRVDAFARNRADLENLGIRVGDYVAIDPQPELTDTGFLNSRHLDDKVGVAAIMGAVKAVREAKVPLEVDCHLLFTLYEEVGSGASSAVHMDVAELLAVDNGTIAPGQNTSERGATVAMMDSAGPFDFHLTHKILRLCRENDVLHSREVFDHYRTDAAAAVEAGHDVRPALICFGVDGSHGYERVHMDSVRAVADLVSLYIQSEPTFKSDAEAMVPFEEFPESYDIMDGH